MRWYNVECGTIFTSMIELRYESWFLPLTTPLGLGPSHSDVTVADGALHVCMGWAFSAGVSTAGEGDGW